MRKHLMVAVAVLAIVAIAMPAFALEVTYGGLFRARYFSQSDFQSYAAGNDLEAGSVNWFDHLNRGDQRLRMYMYFVASENLRVVTKFEANSIWGDAGPAVRTGNYANWNGYGGGNVGADVNNLLVKNSYLDFAIPTTPVRATVGVQGIALIDSWVVDDDFSAALATANFDPIKVTVGYVAGQNYDVFHETENIDDLVLAVNYAQGPWKATLVGFWQDAHNTAASIFPQIIPTPIWGVFPPSPTNNVFPFDPDETFTAENNNLFDLGLSVNYKISWLSAYVNFVKNLGSVDMSLEGDPRESVDYTGWMIDAGVNYFCGPYTFNLGGFYTSGPELKDDHGEIELESSDIEWFTYPLDTSKYFSEIMGGGILDNTAPNGGYWRGYPMPFNIWTVTVGAAWQVLEKTKLSASYWYFGTSNDVPSEQRANGHWDFASDLGHEFDVYLTQGIVGGLNLDLVGAYMITGDAYRVHHFGEVENDDDTYELGARLQWSF